MATPTILNMTIDSLLSGNYYKEGVITNAVQEAKIRWATTYTFGTGNNQANRFIELGTVTGDRNEVILAGASQNFDMFGSLTDGLGNTISLATIKELLIVNLAVRQDTPSYSLTVSGNLFTNFGSSVTSFLLWPNDSLRFSSPRTGYTVTNTSAERLTLNPGSNSFHVYVAALGVA